MVPETQCPPPVYRRAMRAERHGYCACGLLQMCEPFPVFVRMLDLPGQMGASGLHAWDDERGDHVECRCYSANETEPRWYNRCRSTPVGWLARGFLLLGALLAELANAALYEEEGDIATANLCRSAALQEFGFSADAALPRQEWPAPEVSP